MDINTLMQIFIVRLEYLSEEEKIGLTNRYDCVTKKLSKEDWDFVIDDWVHDMLNKRKIIPDDEHSRKFREDMLNRDITPEGKCPICGKDDDTEVVKIIDDRTKLYRCKSTNEEFYGTIYEDESEIDSLF